MPLTDNQIDYILDFIKPQKGIPEKTALSIVKKQKKGLKEQLSSVEVHPDDIDELKREIIRYYYTSLITPGESVGMIAAQSFGEANTQNTLNSIIWTEEIMCEVDGKVKVIPIGQMIDDLLRNGSNIQHIPENRTEYMSLRSGFRIPSCDRNGNTKWYKIEAVTRHLPVGDLVKVRTRSGREVTATQSKSFLVWNEHEFIATQGSDIKVGDIVPVTKSLERPNIVETLNLRDIFPPSKYIYTDEIIKALKCPAYQWRSQNGVTFTVPYKNKDICFEKRNSYFMSCDKGFIYMHESRGLRSHIPSEIVLDEGFGFFVGLYLSEGWVTKTFLGISNNDSVVRKRITDYCDRYGITYHLVSSNEKNEISEALIIHSILLARLFKQICNTGSDKKVVPEFVYGAPNDFIKGMIDGYFSGGGSVDKCDGTISVYSVSKSLLTGISVLLTYYGIHVHMSEWSANHNNKRVHTIRISNGFAQIFASIFTLTDQSKQQRITDTNKYKFEHSQERFPDRDVYFDEVVSVEYVTSEHEFVYDLTVETTRNFQLWNGFNCRDTFHKAGDTDKTVVVGVARFEELLSVTKSPKGKCCSVYFTEGNTSVKELRKTIGSSIVELTIEKLAVSIVEVMNKEDEPWYDIFKVLYGSDFCEFSHCITLKMNIEMLHEYSLTLQDISNIIHEKYDDLHCVFSPDSVGQIDIFADTTGIDISEEVMYVTNDNKELIYMKETVKPNITQMHICGIPGIKHIYYLRDKSRPDEWMIETDGSNFPMLMAHPSVDKTRTVSNDPLDMIETLGIEAANKTIYQEFLTLMPKINKCHAKLLCDKMTYTGIISSISRYAMRKDESGPMGKASFEETLENFLGAAVNGETETTRGVSASIICGKRSKIGTGLCTIHVDTSMLTNQNDNETTINKHIEQLPEQLVDPSVTDAITNIMRKPKRVKRTKVAATK